jgi:hypothetical protein
MSDLLLAIGLVAVACYAIVLRFRVRRLAKSIGLLIKGMQNFAEGMTKLAELSERQSEVNHMMESNLEILGIHTKLIPPSVSYEASQFLAWVNKKKEERDNG